MNVWNMLLGHIARPERSTIRVEGLSGSSDSLFFAYLKKGKALVVAPTFMKGESFWRDLQSMGEEAVLLPERELLSSGFYGGSREIFFERAEVLEKVLRGDATLVVSIKSLAQPVLQAKYWKALRLTFDLNTSMPLEEVTERLVALGYERSYTTEKVGDFSLRGDILDVFVPGEEYPFRIEFFGDEIDSLRLFDPLTQSSVETVQQVVIGAASESMMVKGLEAFPVRSAYEQYAAKGLSEDLVSFGGFEQLLFLEESECMTRLEDIYQDFLLRLQSGVEEETQAAEAAHSLLSPEKLRQMIGHVPTLRFSRFHRGGADINLNGSLLPEYKGNFSHLAQALRERKLQGFRQMILIGEKDDVLEDFLRGEELFVTRRETPVAEGEIRLVKGHLGMGFLEESEKIALYTRREIFGYARTKARRHFGENTRPIDSFFDLKPGDYVVHVHHGIGKYLGLTQREVDGVMGDYLSIEYKDSDHLMIPTHSLHLIQRYLGSDARTVSLSKLGGKDWQRKKERAQKSIDDMAHELLDLYARRSAEKGFAFGEDTPWQREFEMDFPFEETPDQLRCVEELKADMEKSEPMDRLLCGDVGFGKTEVALRGVFKAAMQSKQSLILVPTTVLAQQHYENIRERFMHYPIKVEMLSRLRTAKERAQILKGMASGTVDVVVGTHMALGKNVTFHDLGLLVIDEEQRFGVAHKEKIRKMKLGVDTLSMSATPIPRTLHMSLGSIRDLSILNDPPKDRYPIQTYITAMDDGILREAVLREVERGGQVYYIYNRIEDMERVLERLRRLLPEIRISYVHGRMNERQLEDTMLAFRAGESDVLLSTTLIETGMDIANVNTILIENAQNLGLSQLYQLRGRVGRSNRIAYAYLFFPRDKILTEEAVARLETIREFTDFGSGFKVALRDMEIRGSGHLLGSSQSGHFADIGYELYMQMLMETAKKLKGEPIKQVVQTQIDLGISAYLPEAYISHSGVRMEIYRRIRDIDSREAMEAMEEELLDRFGDLPKEAMNLLETALIGSLASTVPFKEIRRYGDEIRCYFVEEMMPPIEWITQVDKTLSPIVRMHLHKNPRLIISPENPGDTQVLLDIFERLVLFKEEPEGYNEP